MAKWRVPLVALHPEKPNGLWDVGVSSRKIQYLLDNGHRVKQFRMRLLEETLAAPDLLYKGWYRPDKEECLVYVGSPGRDYHGELIERPPPPGQRFLVFVLPDGTIDDWNWRPEEETNPELVDGVKGELIWPK